MQKFRPDSVGKICLSLLSLSLLTQTVFGYEEDRVSYLDSVSSAYMYNTQDSDSSLLDMNSIDARGVEATLKLDSIPAIANSNSRINLSLRDSDLKQALRMIADKGGLNIVFDKSVDGKITLDLNDVTVNDAFMTIFKSSQLTYTIDGNTITVMTLEASKNMAYTRQNMTIIPIKYVNSQSVANFLNSNLFSSNIFGLSNKPIVTANPRTNQIMVFGTLADVNAIKRVLPMVDTKPMVNSFKVNHTTPEEMAKLLCEAMFTDGQSSSSSSSSNSSSDDRISLGAGQIACKDESEKSGGGSNSTDLSAFKGSPLTIAYFPELGKINTYGGSVEQIDIIKNFIKQHDKKQLMAYIELSVIELNEEGTKTFSNTWNLWTPFISLGFDGESLSTTSDVLLWDKNLDNHIKSNNKALLYSLNYILKNNNGRVLTNPKIMVTNGKKATIDMTSDYIKSVTSQVLQNSNSITAAVQKTYEIGSDEGLLIEIIPFISPDGYVSMNITPEFSTVKNQVTAKGMTGEDEIVATLLQRRDLELKNIRIKDGETLVLAGLIKENESQDTKKVPLLGDLPLIGSFFRNNTTIKKREELVIVVTPHIVKDGEDATANGQIYDL